jgi:hypothetical protein
MKYKFQVGDLVLVLPRRRESKGKIGLIVSIPSPDPTARGEFFLADDGEIENIYDVMIEGEVWTRSESWLEKINTSEKV